MHLTLKKLLLKDENWYRYRQFYSEYGGIRESVDYSINKILSCRITCEAMHITIAPIPPAPTKSEFTLAAKTEAVVPVAKSQPITGYRRIKSFYRPAHGSTLPLPCPKP
jgi:hypothetical protein